MMDEVKVIQVLRRVEWVKHDHYEAQSPSCPCCQGLRYGGGHREDCKLAALLAEAGDLPTIDLTPGHVTEALTFVPRTKLGALMGAELLAEVLKVFNLFGVPEDASLCVCDSVDPDQRFIIRHIARTQGEAVEGESGE